MALTGLELLGAQPISYLGTVHRSVAVFRVGLLVATALLTAFSIYVSRTFPVGRGFLVAFLVGQAGQVVTAVVPLSGPGSFPTVHTTGGIVLGISLPVLIWRFAAGQPAERWRTLAYRLVWLELAACVSGIALSRWGRAAIAEILPAVGFHLWIGVVTAKAGSPRAPLAVAAGAGQA